MTKQKNILYLGLSAFSQAGGIEKVNKCWLKALSLLSKDNIPIHIKSHILLDHEPDERYIYKKYFKGFCGDKIKFMISSLWSAMHAHIIIAGHINLSPLLYLIKILRPSTIIYLHAHGIEIWRPLNRLQKITLKQADKILAVSEFTKQQLIKINAVEPNKITVLPNAIDPYFNVPENLERPSYLMERYGINKEQKILFTLARLSSSEQYKGYDKIIEIIPLLIEKYPDLIYLIGGKADDEENQRIQDKINDLSISKNVNLLGYIEEEELTDHYLLSDIFVMPSTGEGFGIAFIEASACGRPVLAGNADGSSQAIKMGETGLLCDTENHLDILDKLNELISFQYAAKEIQQTTIKNYSFKDYSQVIKRLIIDAA